MLRSLTFAMVLLAAPALAQRDCGALPATLEGEAYAIDGDTLAMLSDGRRTPDIRLFGIQAPELRNKATGLESREGMQSRAALDELLASTHNKTACRSVEWDRYCRVVAICSPKGETATLSGSMVLAGWAYVFTTYALRPPAGLDITTLLANERQARQAKRGLWRAWLHD